MNPKMAMNSGYIFSYGMTVSMAFSGSLFHFDHISCDMLCGWLEQFGRYLIIINFAWNE